MVEGDFNDSAVPLASLVFKCQAVCEASSRRNDHRRIIDNNRKDSNWSHIQDRKVNQVPVASSTCSWSYPKKGLPMSSYSCSLYRCGKQWDSARRGWIDSLWRHLCTRRLDWYPPQWDGSPGRASQIRVQVRTICTNRSTSCFVRPRSCQPKGSDGRKWRHSAHTSCNAWPSEADCSDIFYSSVTQHRSVLPPSTVQLCSGIQHHETSAGFLNQPL